MEQYAPDPYQDGVEAIRLELDRNADRSRRRMRKWNRLDGRPAAPVAAAPHGRYRNVVVYVLLDAHRTRVDKVNVHPCLLAGRHQVRIERKVDVQRALLRCEHLGIDLGVRRHAGRKHNQRQRGQRHHGLHIHALAAPCIKHCPCRLRALGPWIPTAGRAAPLAARARARQVPNAGRRARFLPHCGAIRSARPPPRWALAPAAGACAAVPRPSRPRRRPPIPRHACDAGGHWAVDADRQRLRRAPTRLRRGRQAKGTE